MKPHCLLLSSIVALTTLVPPTTWAEIVLIESRESGGGVTSNPPYSDSGSWGNSSAHTTAPGTTSGKGSRYGYGDNCVVTLTPTLTPGDTYVLETSHITSNGSTNLVVNVTYTGCTGTVTDTGVFSSATGSPNWERIGMITVDPGVTTPTITFTYASGFIASTGGRWYSDAYRFINTSDACVLALPQLPVVNGPLSAGQDFVDVPAVNSAATALSVYANGTVIGSKTSGITAGVNRVAVSPLLKGAVIAATQRDNNGVDSCLPAGGQIVGGGPNPPIGVALSIRQNTTLAGPIGANGGNTNVIMKFLGATNTVGPVGTAPAGVKVIYPSNDWQTVTFHRGEAPATPVDPTFLWNSTDSPAPNELKGDFGVLESFAFAVAGEDNGPYEVYIDNIMNGETVIQDFESAALGATEVMFNSPNLSGTTSPFLMSPSPGTIAPNRSVVTNITADTGAQCAFVSWQFKDTNAVNWLRLVAQGSGTPNAQLDLRLPITFRVLLLPVGQKPEPTPPVIYVDPQPQNVLETGTATFRVTARGSYPLQYQWLFNGSNIENGTNSTLVLSNVQLSQAGQYSVQLSNALGTNTSAGAALTVNRLVQTDALTTAWQLTNRSRFYLTNDNATRSIAYTPVENGHLLVASRSGSNAIHVLDATTGDYIRTLNCDTNVINGGTLPLNMVAATESGMIYACNLTLDGTTDPLKIYAWVDDSAEAIPYLAWRGDPGKGTPNRWGDTLAARLLDSDAEVALGSRNGTAVSLIYLAFGPTANPNLIDFPFLAPGSFGLGLAYGLDETIWAKGPGLPLVRIGFDGTVLNTYTSLPALTAIGFDPTRNILAGISVENPDNLRLLDTSYPQQEPVVLDIELFPTDNANINGTGSIAFGSDKVFALDSNNGIMALNIGNLDCRPDRLSLSRSGDTVRITWTRPNYRLLGAPAMLGAATQWEVIPPDVGTTGVATLPVGSGNRFFKLVCP